MSDRVYRNAAEPPPMLTDRLDEGWLTFPMVVDDALHGYRLDRFLHARIPRLSRARIKRIIVAGNVARARAPSRHLRPATRVRAGEVLVIRRPMPEEPEVVLDYDVLFEDEHLLVLDKPAGLPVHPTARYHKHTLTALMRTRLGAEHGWEMAHRLDRETSGVMVFGRRRAFTPPGAVASGAVLKRAFAERRVHKEYLAVVHGELREATTVELPLGPARDSLIRIKMGYVPRDQGGLAAVTEVVPLRCTRWNDQVVTLVRCRPRTGRQHQIRVHLCLIGHPVVGDKLYGLPEERFLEVTEGGRPLAELGADLGLARQALHAASLELSHPATGVPVEFHSPWPADLAEVIAFADAERSAPPAL